jgi:hypothetical protein
MHNLSKSTSKNSRVRNSAFAISLMQRRKDTRYADYKWSVECKKIQSNINITKKNEPNTDGDDWGWY